MLENNNLSYTTHRTVKHDDMETFVYRWQMNITAEF